MAEVVVLDEDFRRYLDLLSSSGIDAVGTDDPGAVDDAEILLASPTLAGRVVHRLASLDWVQSTWAGVDALLAVGIPSGIVVTRLEGVFGTQMREFVLGHLLAHTQRVAERMTARSWDETPPALLDGTTLGIMGTGSIGAAVARAAGHLGMTPVGLSREGRSVPGFVRVHSDRLEFAEGLDHLVAVLPATPGTRHIVDADLFERLEPGGVFINVGRGSAVDTPAVIEALASGRLGRAVLDVLPTEPLPDGDPLWQVEGLVITSHTAAWSRPTDVVSVFLGNLECRRRGEPMRGVIDPERGY
jgi:phosphoglycerate dehydrogenase-like enzyme